MHRHGVNGFDIIESAGQNKSHPALPVIARERHSKDLLARFGSISLGKLERDADIAVHQAQAVIIARHQHGPSLVPLLVAVDQSGLE
ncbi:hypothetical protein D3C71_1790760 [compost metagenome]